MIRYVIKRLLIMIPILLGISFIVLILIDLSPGDVARIVAGPEAEDWEVQEVREALHLNDPLIVRYGRFLWNALNGSFGKSFINKKDVWDAMMGRWMYTVLLAFLSVILAVIIGIPAGIVAATHQYSWRDNVTIVLSLFCVSMPAFWFALLLVQLFSVNLGWLPASGVGSWKNWVLPTVTLALAYTASIARQMRSNMLEVIRQDYIVTARAKGLPEKTVLYRHALKNALIPVIQVVGGLFSMALGGALIAETIFSLPGLGVYSLSALTNRDYPAIQGSVLFLSVIHCMVILLIDVVFAFVDPRIRSQYVRRKTRKVEKVAVNSEA
jgi:peptide/nickel transport system permease protein